MKTFKQIKKVIIAAVGFIVLLTGIILIVLPGPASLVIPAGLAILATEFVWARNLLDKIKSKMGRSRQSVDIN
jgi:tellurite resistance protein TerC